MILKIDEDSEVFLSGAVLRNILDEKLNETEKATLERWLWKYRAALDQIKQFKEDFGKRYWGVFIARCKELGLVADKGERTSKL